LVLVLSFAALINSLNIDKNIPLTRLNLGVKVFLLNVLNTNKEKHMNQITKHEGFFVAPQSFEQLERFAELVAASDMVPKDYKGKPGNVIIAWQFGSEVGLAPMQALQNITAINGRPALALVRNSGQLTFIKETDDGKTARCEVLRKGEADPVVRTFSVVDVANAGLQNKDTHKMYPARMRQMRARSWALRDVFPDVLKGLQVREEVEDISEPINITPAPIMTAPVAIEAPKEVIPPIPTDNPMITDKQLRRMCAIWRETGVPEEMLKDLYRGYGFAHKNLITQDKYDEIVRVVESWVK
jgi:hypothetical protein